VFVVPSVLLVAVVDGLDEQPTRPNAKIVAMVRK